MYQCNGTGYWRRPGKDKGVSASTNYQQSNLLYVFSTSTLFEPERGYTKFAAYTLMEHNGDFKVAAKALMRRGYRGSRGMTPIVSRVPSGQIASVDDLLQRAEGHDA